MVGQLDLFSEPPPAESNFGDPSHPSFQEGFKQGQAEAEMASHGKIPPGSANPYRYPSDDAKRWLKGWARGRFPEGSPDA